MGRESGALSQRRRGNRVRVRLRFRNEGEVGLAFTSRNRLCPDQTMIEPARAESHPSRLHKSFSFRNRDRTIELVLELGFFSIHLAKAVRLSQSGERTCRAPPVCTCQQSRTITTTTTIFGTAYGCAIVCGVRCGFPISYRSNARSSAKRTGQESTSGRAREPNDPSSYPCPVDRGVRFVHGESRRNRPFNGFARNRS
jgi:hypothetical protein